MWTYCINHVNSIFYILQSCSLFKFCVGKLIREMIKRFCVSHTIIKWKQQFNIKYMICEKWPSNSLRLYDPFLIKSLKQILSQTDIIVLIFTYMVITSRKRFLRLTLKSICFNTRNTFPSILTGIYPKTTIVGEPQQCWSQCSVVCSMFFLRFILMTMVLSVFRHDEFCLLLWYLRIRFSHSKAL